MDYDASNNLTPKQERFCQEYTSNGGNASAAYRTAYDTGCMKAESVHREAVRMLNHPKITPRLDVIMHAEHAKYDVSRERLTAQLMRIIDEAALTDKLELVRKACMDVAKLHGLIPNTKKVTHDNTRYQLMGDVVIDGDTMTFNVGG